MFLKFLNLGRGAENPRKANKGEKAVDGEAGLAEGSANPDQSGRRIIQSTASGRESLTKLRSVARGQRKTEQGRGRWFGKPDDARETAAPQPEVEQSTQCPPIPEDQRKKAIEALLELGIDHFTVKSDK